MSPLLFLFGKCGSNIAENVPFKTFWIKGLGARNTREGGLSPTQSCRRPSDSKFPNKRGPCSGSSGATKLLKRLAPNCCTSTGQAKGMTCSMSKNECLTMQTLSSNLLPKFQLPFDACRNLKHGVIDSNRFDANQRPNLSCFI